ncbi:MAG: hypothetical protein ACI4ME_00480 [Aristaeellaceae bacterium]
MKKLYVFVFAIALALAMMPSAWAEDTGLILALDSEYANLGDMNAQVKGNESTARGCLGLGPVANGDGTFGDAYMKFTVEVEKTGVYALTVRYAAKAKEGQIRCADVIVNDGTRVALPIVGMADWNIYADAVVEVLLNAGTNTIVLKNVENFDNSTYKAINVDYISWALVKEAMPAADVGSMLALDSEYANLGNMDAQVKGNESTARGCLGLGPVDNGDGTFSDAYMQFNVNVENAGVYTLTLRYAAKAKEGQIRCADMIVNDGARIALPIEGQSDWNVYVDAVVDVELKAGINKIVLKNVENFDNSTYKAINVDFLSWAPKAE